MPFLETTGLVTVPQPEAGKASADWRVKLWLGVGQESTTLPPDCATERVGNEPMKTPYLVPRARHSVRVG